MLPRFVRSVQEKEKMAEEKPRKAAGRELFNLTRFIGKMKKSKKATDNAEKNALFSLKFTVKKEVPKDMVVREEEKEVLVYESDLPKGKKSRALPREEPFNVGAWALFPSRKRKLAPSLWRSKQVQIPRRHARHEDISHDRDQSFYHPHPEDLGWMDYTEVRLKEPEDWSNSGLKLRFCDDQEGVEMQHVAERVPTELFIVVTLYNEDEKELDDTMSGIVRAVRYYTEMRRYGWGVEDAWREVVVCIVADGAKVCNEGVLQWLKERANVFDGDFVFESRDRPGAPAPAAHLFETTAIVHEKANQALEPAADNAPLQLMFCLKEKNKGKLDSHRWFFQAFAEQLNPKYCVLLDIGTIPRPDAIFKLWSEFEKHPDVGGCCGEIAPLKPQYFNPVVAAQVFEYKMSHVLDKAFESAMGYISVLPGAFSAYRWKAIRDEVKVAQGRKGKPMKIRTGPLQEYFKSITTSPNELTPFDHNMYLAEDRILCFAIVSRQLDYKSDKTLPRGWKLSYVKNAIAETDIPNELTVLIRQRRRWLNGSLFAMIYSITHFHMMMIYSNHSFPRKLGFMFEFFYYFLQTVLTWLAVAIMYLGVMVTINGAVEEDWFNESVWDAFRLTYTFMIVCIFLVALGNKPTTMKLLFYLIASFYAVLMVFATITAVFLVLDIESATLPLSGKVVLFLAVGLYFVYAWIHREFTNIVLTFPAYVAMVPTYVNIMSIFSFCNLHDVSWGTRDAVTDDTEENNEGPSDSGGESDRSSDVEYGNLADMSLLDSANNVMQDQEQADIALKAFRTWLLILWVASNGGLISLIGVLEWYEGFLIFTFGLVLFFNGVRAIGSTFFMLSKWKLTLSRKFGNYQINPDQRPKTMKRPPILRH